METTCMARYQIGRQLGEGGYGQVFEAWDRVLSRMVAIKRPRHAAQMGATDLATDLATEAGWSGLSKHRAFVTVLALAGSGSERALVMERVRGSTLRSVLQRRSAGIGMRTSLSIAAQVAAAMAQLHAAGLIHGDLTPSNLMLERRGRVRILDLGLARRFTPLPVPGSEPAASCGTLAYLSPECLLGHPPGPAADIYALGVVLYEMLVGQRPFPGLHGMALATARLQTASTSWPWPDRSDAAIVTLVRAMTASDPFRRLASMAAAGAAIDAAVDAKINAKINATINATAPRARG